MADYPMGARVTFIDSRAVPDIVRNPEAGTVLAFGTVNGQALDDLPGGPVMVPVWCEREGREPTTVYVDSRNIMSVEHAGEGG